MRKFSKPGKKLRGRGAEYNRADGISDKKFNPKQAAGANIMQLH